MTELEFYRELYKNADTGYDAVSILMPKTTDEKLRHDMALHMDGYRYFARLAKEKINDAHEDAKKENPLVQIPARIGMMMHTVMDRSTSHMAELMINGSNASILDMRKQLNRLRRQNNTEEAADICQKMIDFEQDNIKRMQNYISRR